MNFEKLSNAERSRKFHKSIQKGFPTPKSKKSPEENEVHLGLPCGRQKAFVQPKYGLVILYRKYS